VSCFSGKISIDLLRALFLSDIFIKTRARVVSFDFSTLYTHRERYRCAFRVEKREHIKKKACGNTLVRVFDSSASREGTRAPGEETQGIRPPFLNFFLYIYVFLSFNACVINLSLSLFVWFLLRAFLASMSVRIDSLLFSLFYRNRCAADVRTARSARIRINTTAGEGVRVAVVPLTARIVVVVIIITGSTSRRWRRRWRRQSGTKRRRLRAW